MKELRLLIIQFDNVLYIPKPLSPLYNIGMKG